MYERLLAALRASAVGQGTCELIRPAAAWPDNPTAQNFVLIQWQRQTLEFDLVVINLAPHRSQCYAPLRLPDLSNWSLRDRLSPESYVRSGADLRGRGLYLDLPAHGAHIFHFQPVT